MDLQEEGGKDRAFPAGGGQDRLCQAGEAFMSPETGLRSFLDVNPDPSFLVDREGRVLVANHAAAGLLGRDAGLLTGTSIFDAMPGTADLARDAFAEALAGRVGGAFAMEISGRYFSTILSPLPGASGEVDRVAVFARDFTDRKRMEDALRQANERLHLLTAVTRHDVLNDIAALGMYLGLQGTAQGPGQDPPERLGALLRSLRRKMEFTRDYADLGLGTPRWEGVAGIVERAVSAVDTGALTVDIHLPDIEIYADPLFERAITNLVDNTLRHGEHATSLRVLARMDGDACTLIVEDDGVGVPPGMKDSVFRPGIGRHTGFGLFLVREVLGITGMSIRETGQPGRGARFEIRIPRGGFRVRNGSGGVHGDARVRARG